MKQFSPKLFAVLALSLASNSQISTVAAQGLPYSLLTITNPVPAQYSYFGWSVAPVGDNHILVGAPFAAGGLSYASAGEAYLYGTNGQLHITFTNPTPEATDRFGWSVAAIGTDRVLIGAPDKDIGKMDAGAAYLFNTNGTLLATFTNSTPAIGESFGSSVAAVGTDRVLIGAVGNDTGASDAGAAYLLTTNGTLLTTFTNPTPALSDLFGSSLAAVGTGRVLIGAHQDNTGATDAGAAYLFHTDGTLLTTFTNPTPAFADLFGYSMAAVGTDRVLIGAYQDNTGGDDAGVAYLFTTNGALLTTFTNPAPTLSDWFGYSVAAVGSDRVLIGARYRGAGSSYAGTAYLFSTHGALLLTFTEPAPSSLDPFGWSVAASGTGRLLIGKTYGGGAVYVVSLRSPSLSINNAPELSTITVSWSSIADEWALERTGTLPSVAAGSWTPVPPPYQTNPTTISVTFTNPTGNQQFFRLRKQ